MGQRPSRGAPAHPEVSDSDPDRFSEFGLDVVADRIVGFRGPLAGIQALMQAGRDRGASHVLVVPADTPFLPDDLASRLSSADPEQATVRVACSLGRQGAAATGPRGAAFRGQLRDGFSADIRPDARCQAAPRHDDAQRPTQRLRQRRGAVDDSSVWGHVFSGSWGHDGSGSLCPTAAAHADADGRCAGSIPPASGGDGSVCAGVPAGAVWLRPDQRALCAAEPRDVAVCWIPSSGSHDGVLMGFSGGAGDGWFRWWRMCGLLLDLRGGARISLFADLIQGAER